MKRPDPHAAKAQLRARAERQRLVASAPLDPADALRLAQELQVHQIELEMQYEELLLAQADAEASRAEYMDLYDFAPVGYCTLAPDGTLARLNLYLAQLLGPVRQQLLGRRLAQFVAPAERLAFSQFLARLWAAPGQRHTCELAMLGPGEGLFFAQLEGLVSAAPSEAYTSAPCRLALTDVTARRQAADALAASEARFRATFEQSHDGQALLRDLLLVDANAGALRLLGQPSKSQVLGRHLADFWPDDQPGGQPVLATLLACAEHTQNQGWYRQELRRFGADGQPVWDELSFDPVAVQGEALLHLTWRDVTDRRLGQERLRESEERLQLALAASATGVWSWDLASDVVEQDAEAQQVLGTAAPRVLWADLKATVHLADRPVLEAVISQAMAAHSHFELEHRLVRPNGEVRQVAASGRFVYDAATGQPLRMAGLVRDVTAQAQAQEALRFQYRLLGNILHNLPVILARLAPNGRYRALAGAGLRRLGLADGALVGQLAAERFPQEAAQITHLLAGQSNSYVSSFEYEGQPVHFLTYSFWDPDHQEGVVFSIDVTESEVLKRALARQQQVLLAAVLTAQEEERRRIAEALHNGVGQLLYATRLHLDALPPSEPVQAGQGLLSEAIRATRTISFELTPSVLEDLGLPAALRELARRIPAAQLAIDLNLNNLDAPLPALLATAVYRAVQELLSNVMKHAHAREVFVQVAREGPEVHISVEDDGRGFDAAAAVPGQGLAGIRTRAGLLGGTLTIRARPGQGTGVFLVLPVEE
ncbi:PAS domain S-box protein [Hymenobacter nivis]|uniref:histidine kinase n=1 Tax=Hymenobacter nivis TaxID=1850093 RepID=A0A502H0W9_9BACT|nr:PAS domain S-box protein [Hymenobacter nivis]TPG67006.1 PAS domain S-box protein [Hymenobacter nivis]